MKIKIEFETLNGPAGPVRYPQTKCPHGCGHMVGDWKCQMCSNFDGYDYDNSVVECKKEQL